MIFFETVRQVHASSQGRQPGKYRFLTLCTLLLVAIGYNFFLLSVAPPAVNALESEKQRFAFFWLLSFLPYLIGCIVILATRAPAGRQQRLELLLILLGTLLLHIQFVLLLPDMSPDAWRYLWDARITLHGFSPYTTIPGSSVVVYLRNFVFNNTRYRGSLTLYPPGAQAFFLFSYLLAPNSMIMFKCIVACCDLVTTFCLAVFLLRKGLDPARCIIYGWSPLVIIEFALQGHVDAIAVMCVLLALLPVDNPRPWARILTGFLIALATLTRLYPIVLLAVSWRWRSWLMPLSCAATIVLAYIPYLILGHGRISGVVGSYYTDNFSTNASLIAVVLYRVRQLLSLNSLLVDLIDAVIVGIPILFVWLWWQRGHMQRATGLLISFGVVFLVLPHLFPWYTPIFLPLVALLVGPLWVRGKGLQIGAIAACLFWYFTTATILQYFIAVAPQSDWYWYYDVAYAVPILGLVAVFFGRALAGMARGNG